MKYTLFLFIFSISLFADTIYNGLCVTNFSIESKFISTSQSQQLINIDFTNKYNKDISVEFDYQTLNNLIINDGFFTFNEDNKQCELYSNFMGINQFQFNFLMGLSGLLSAFIISSTILKRF